jgi:hypothetical protein
MVCRSELQGATWVKWISRTPPGQLEKGQETREGAQRLIVTPDNGHHHRIQDLLGKLMLRFTIPPRMTDAAGRLRR